MASLYSAVAKKAPVLPKVTAHVVGKSYHKGNGKVAANLPTGAPVAGAKKAHTLCPSASPGPISPLSPAAHQTLVSSPAPLLQHGQRGVHSATLAHATADHHALGAHAFAAPYQPSRSSQYYQHHVPTSPMAHVVAESSTPLQTSAAPTAYILPPGTAPTYTPSSMRSAAYNPSATSPRGVSPKVPIAVPSLHAPSMNHQHSLMPQSRTMPVTNGQHRPIARAEPAYLSLPTSPEPGMIVEFLADDGSFRLGLVSSEFSGATPTWEVMEKNGQSIEHHKLTASQITFCWPHLHNFNSYHFKLDDLPALTGQVQMDLERCRTTFQLIYGKWIDSEARATTVESVAHSLFNGDARPHDFYVAHRLLQESDCFVRPGKVHLGTAIVSEYHINPLNVMSSLQKASFQEKKETDRKLFLHRLARKLWASSGKCEPLEKYVSSLPALTDAERRLNLSWNIHHDAAFLTALKQFAFADETSSSTDLQHTKTSLLDPLNIPASSETVFNLLVKIGIIGKYDNPHLARYPTKLDFSPNEMQSYRSQGSSLANVDRDCKNRMDYRNCGPVFAIDSRLESDEIDDAVGLYRAPDGTTWVHVHIADPSRFVHPNDSLDILARQRVQSLFLPEKVVTMFPPNFSRTHFSLLPNKTNYAMTFAVQLNATTGQILNYEITPSLIDRVTALSYDQADEALIAASRKETPRLHDPLPASYISSLNTLLELSDARRRYRERQGAVFLDQPRPEVEVKHAGEHVTVTAVRDTESLTRGMVSEFMILVGEVTALFASRHAIPIPFRSQAKRLDKSLTSSSSSNSAIAPLFEPPVSPLKKSNPKSAVNAPSASNSNEALASQQTRLFPAITDVEPGEHAGLGLAAYCQATSPIRRYTDLIVHHQIKSYLRGEALPFSSAKLSSMIAQLESTQGQLNSLANNSSRYWILRYLERQDANRVYEALVSGDSLSSVSYGALQCVIWMLDLGWKTSLTLEAGRNPARGEKIKVRVHRVDAFNDDLELMEVESSAL